MFWRGYVYFGVYVLILYQVILLWDWNVVVKELDVFEGNDEWKFDDVSGDYYF